MWEVPWPGNVAVIPTPIVAGNQVFVTSGYGAGCMLVEVSPQYEATTVYANKVMKNKHGGVIRVGDYLYGYSDDDGWLCLDVRTGERKWRERDALGMGAIGYADGKFYCVDQDEGNVVLIDASPEGWTERGRFVLAPLSTTRKPQRRHLGAPGDRRRQAVSARSGTGVLLRREGVAIERRHTSLAV